MPAIRIILLALSLIFLSCKSKEPVKFYGPAVSPQMEIISGKGGLIRSFYFDIIIEHRQREDWEYLSAIRDFKGGGKGFPLEPSFHIIIENIWNRPVKVSSVELVCGSERFKPEYFATVGDRDFPAKRYSINLAELWKTRRILSRDELIGRIDFQNNSILYELDFIAPGDRVSSVYTFNSISSSCAKKSISISIKYMNMEKVIDFDITEVMYSRK